MYLNAFHVRYHQMNKFKFKYTHFDINNKPLGDNLIEVTIHTQRYEEFYKINPNEVTEDLDYNYFEIWLPETWGCIEVGLISTNEHGTSPISNIEERRECITPAPNSFGILPTQLPEPSGLLIGILFLAILWRKDTA